MKKLWILSILTVFMATSVMAQEKTKESKEKMKQEKVEWEKKIKEELKLAPDQLEKYDALNKEYSEKMETLSNDASMTEDLRKEKKMALKKEKETKLMEILTPEQQTKYKELMEKKKANKPAQ